MSRYQKYSYLTQSFQLSKLLVYKTSDLITIIKVDVQAGHFKPSSTHVEHGLLIYNITGQVPVTELFKHGKRLRNTVVIKTTTPTVWKWSVIDKFLNTFLSSISDLSAYQSHKTDLVSSMYSWRIRNFFEWADADVLLSDRIMKKDVFLPLFFNIKLSSKKSHKSNEHVLRMLRIPATLYKKSMN